ncbi:MULTISPECIES: hypothetical protein [unclassified Tolypothrix]|uniref:hypothetical protein n=1 Tax=unclassified Tolypothrix TaxID=2649714 RepID=UPI0005EAAB0A|nr:MULTISPECIES: hypothetical protein [unclassified Tolypothrix]BAY91265.1 hypothetical protein NIES3275_32880 [Microchaete diplosiphon NIES-3275]EKF04209.1 hypothetical protein FDUTEX481_01887 [Tolypothrix sp. PCC 7601]MBE9080905.1 hypothetical protein [Tolypothrix sp. LEGE 11397]UYD25339.1 hypothetical protein HGR01_28800 [Tolypothrix sp. PCC 7712]UYD32417.1 hypothetical protein HG267_25765 [Tolypothrix sp. PCC 7601]
MTIEQKPKSDPHNHTAKIKGKLNDLIAHLREDITKIEDPKAQALFETTAEVLKGLVNAYNDYEQHSEEAWK